MSPQPGCWVPDINPLNGRRATCPIEFINLMTSMYHHSIPHSQQSITRSVTTCHISRMGNKTCNSLSSTKIYCTWRMKFKIHLPGHCWSTSISWYICRLVGQTCNLFYQRRCSLSLIILHTQQTGCVIPRSKTHTHTKHYVLYSSALHESEAVLTDDTPYISPWRASYGVSIVRIFSRTRTHYRNLFYH